MSEDTTYNGWKNYPTWAVNLWLSNDEALYRETLEVVGITISDPDTYENVTAGIWTRAEALSYMTADRLRQWVTDDVAPDLGASFAADLLGYALGEVDWDEIATAWLENELSADAVARHEVEFGK